MSVYIKGMEMPINCPCELVGVGYDLYCSFAHGIPARVREYDECCEKLTRPTWCPLVEIPPHGDLIDRDRLGVVSWKEDEVEDSFDAGVLFVLDRVDELPAIIPEEE